MNRPDGISSQEIEARERRVAVALTSSGISRDALKAGERMPAFVLAEADGRKMDSRALLAAGPLVIVFLRGVWCPLSNSMARAVEDIRAEIEKRGAAVITISPQLALHGRRMKRRNKTDTPLLVDAGGAITAQFGVRWSVPSDLREAYHRTGVDLVQFNGEDGWALPMNAVYVADVDGIIAYAAVDPDFRRSIEPADVVPTLDRLKAVPGV
jgi:peroxiredoxin